jgi:NTP pyrophosphatase (non-canonical NTP hydrolase)
MSADVPEPSPPITLASFQKAIADVYYEKDAARGLAGTFMWFTEEVGELARALKRREPDPHNLNEEFSDVLAWLCTLASIVGVDMEQAAQRYLAGCPRCAATPCSCGERTRFQVRSVRE